MEIHQLPTLNAFLNGLCAVWLVLGLHFVKRGEIGRHRAAMLGALATSALFLVSYLTYHFQTGSTRFQGGGVVRVIYFGILVSHTVLAAAVVPMALVTLGLALRGRFARHRRIARWTWPVWMYVSVTGIVVYLMLYHLDPRLAPR
jgi:putative membrane protein